VAASTHTPSPSRFNLSLGVAPHNHLVSMVITSGWAKVKFFPLLLVSSNPNAAVWLSAWSTAN
jgi:hypothetical protein